MIRALSRAALALVLAVGCAGSKSAPSAVVDAGPVDALAEAGPSKPSSMALTAKCGTTKVTLACDTAQLASTRRIFKIGDVTYYEAYCFAKPPSTSPFLQVRVAEGEGGDFSYPDPAFENGNILIAVGCADGRTMQLGFTNTRSGKANLSADKRRLAGDFEGVFFPATVALSDGEASGEFDVDFSDR